MRFKSYFQDERLKILSSKGDQNLENELEAFPYIDGDDFEEASCVESRIRPESSLTRPNPSASAGQSPLHEEVSVDRGQILTDVVPEEVGSDPNAESIPPECQVKYILVTI